MSAVRAVRKPRKDFPSENLPVVEFKGLDAQRVHSKDYPAVGFRVVTNHRFSHPASPGGLLYLGESLETCLWESFGDELPDNQDRLSASRWKSSHLSRVQSKATFRICDLTDENVRLALGVDLSALLHPDLAIPHEWGLAIQNHPSAVDGLRYLSRLNQQPSVVLFERPGASGKLWETLIGALPDVIQATEFLVRKSIKLI